jgi:hypothetical protein
MGFSNWHMATSKSQPKTKPALIRTSFQVCNGVFIRLTLPKLRLSHKLLL